MEVGRYWKRFKACKSYKDKCSLQREVLEVDNTLRKLFTQQRDSWVVPELENPYETLIPVFDHFDLFKCLVELPEEAAIPKVFELGEHRKPQGTSSIVNESDFTRNFCDLFTEGSLKYLDWEGVFAAGGSVMACIQPLPPKHDISNIARRRYMHDERFPGSDVDLFLYGMDADQARKKIVQIYDAVREAVPFEVLCFRSAHTITLVSEYPFRHIQIILRLYSSPLEVLTGFDVDSCAVGFDGSKVWVTQRCHSALVNQCNPVNLTRRSPTYEMRLAKYAQRGFEVPVSELQKDRIDPTIFERPWNKVMGLAKLLLLERLRTPEARFRYREQHRTKKMRNMYSSAFAMRFGMRGMLRNPWMASRMEKITPTRQGAEASDYSTVFLPWGKGYNAKRCRGLMLAKDRILNDPYVSKGRKYKLHPCFIGTAEEVIEDCSPKDPPIPDTVDQKELEGYVRGALVFIEDDPGRQMIGSFHPIEDEDWSNGAYFTVEMNELFIAANADNSEQMVMLLESGVNPNSTDFTGRTPLHITAFSGSSKCAQILLEHNARMITRMTDGRTVLHICAAYGHTELITMFLEKSNQNSKTAEAARNSSGDDDGKKVIEESVPADILDINAQEWNHCLGPLQVAVIFGQASAAEVLLKHGADANKTWALGETDDYDYEVASSLSLVMNVSHWDPAKSAKLLQLLLKYGCDVARLDQSLRNILHIAAIQGRHEFITQIVQAAPVMKEKGLSVISLDMTTPLVAAVNEGREECVKTLLHLGAKLESTDDDCQLARRRSSAVHGKGWSTQSKKRQLSEVTPQEMPYALWTAVTRIRNNIVNVSKALNLLEEEEAAAAVGGRDRPTEVKKQDPFGIIKVLIGHGANVNQISQDHSKETMVDFVKAELSGLEQLKQGDEKEKFMLKCKQKESSCSEPTIVADGILISCQTGLPASYKSQSSIRRLLLKVNQDSYVLPMLEAKALEQDIEPLLENDQHYHGDSIDDHINVHKNLLKILKDAGGVEYHKLMGKRAKKSKAHETDEDIEDEANKPKKLTVEKEISRYYLLSHEITQDTYGREQDLGMLLETHLQSSYHQLFEAVWQGDTEHVERVTLTGAPEDRLLVCVQNRYGQTPLTLAVLRGHVALVAKLVEIAAKQYVPEEKQDHNLTHKGPLDAGRLNNYAVEALVDELGDDSGFDDEDMDEGVPEEDLDDNAQEEEEEEEEDIVDDAEDDFSEGDSVEASLDPSAEESHENLGVGNLLSEVASMRNDARKAAQSAAAQQAGVSADIGTEKVRLCHIPPELLLSHAGIFPAELVECNLKEEWRFDAKRLIRFVWGSCQNPDNKVLKASMDEFLKHPPYVDVYSPYYMDSRVKAFRRVTPLEISILMKRVDILGVLLDACELWDKNWKDESVERARLIRDAPDEAPKDTRIMEEEYADEHKVVDQEKKSEEGKDQTNLSCKVVRSQGSGKQHQDLAILVDDPSTFSCLIARTGASYAFGQFLTDLKAALMEEKKRQKKLGNKTDKLQALEDDFTDVSRTLRTTTALHTAVMYGAKNMLEWLLKGCAVEALGQFLAAKANSSEARTAERLGKFLLHNQFAGISDQGSPEAALSAYYCGHVHMEDDMKRTAFHTTVAVGSADMLKFLIKTTRAMGKFDATLDCMPSEYLLTLCYNPSIPIEGLIGLYDFVVAKAVLNKPRMLEPHNSEPSNILNTSSTTRISGTTPLQDQQIVLLPMYGKVPQDVPHLICNRSANSSGIIIVLCREACAAKCFGRLGAQASALIGHMDHFNLLLDAGAEIRVPDGVSSRGWNLLAFCIAGKGLSSSLSPHTPTHSHPENTASAIDMVKSLVKHPRVGIKVVREMLSECMGHSKITPLMLAASLENVAMVELLKEMLLEGVYIQQSSEGRTVLHIASNTGKPDLVHSLLTAEHLSPSPQEDSKLTAIKAEIVDATAQEDHVGFTPTDIAMEFVCSTRRKKLKTNECEYLYSNAEEDEGWDLRVHADVRKASTSRKRIRATFEDVKASTAKAAEDVGRSEDINMENASDVEDLSIDVNSAVAEMIPRSSGCRDQ